MVLYLSLHHISFAGLKDDCSLGIEILFRILY